MKKNFVFGFRIGFLCFVTQADYCLAPNTCGLPLAGDAHNSRSQKLWSSASGAYSSLSGVVSRCKRGIVVVKDGVGSWLKDARFGDYHAFLDRRDEEVVGMQMRPAFDKERQKEKTDVAYSEFVALDGSSSTVLEESVSSDKLNDSLPKRLINWGRGISGAVLSECRRMAEDLGEERLAISNRELRKLIKTETGLRNYIYRQETSAWRALEEEVGGLVEKEGVILRANRFCESEKIKNADMAALLEKHKPIFEREKVEAEEERIKKLRLEEMSYQQDEFCKSVYQGKKCCAFGGVLQKQALIAKATCLRNGINEEWGSAQQKIVERFGEEAQELAHQTENKLVENRVKDETLGRPAISSCSAGSRDIVYSCSRRNLANSENPPDPSLQLQVECMGIRDKKNNLKLEEDRCFKALMQKEKEELEKLKTAQAKNNKTTDSHETSSSKLSDAVRAHPGAATLVISSAVVLPALILRDKIKAGFKKLRSAIFRKKLKLKKSSLSKIK